MEIKRLQFKVADIDTQKRLVKAYFSAFGNLDGDGDIVTKGAFKKTFSEHGPKGKDIVRHLLNHEQKTLPIGKVMELGEDGHGAFFVSKLASTKMGNDVYSLYQDNIINNHSYGFMITKQAIRSEARYIQEVKLYEVSTVTTWSSNELTPTIEVKHGAVIDTPPPLIDSLSLIKPSRYTLQEQADMETIYKLLNF